MLHFKTAHYADYAIIAKLHSDSWKASYRGILSDTYLDYEAEKDRMMVWHQRLSNPTDNQIITLATWNEKPVGFSCLYLDDDPVFGSYIDNLHVLSDQQKMGIGRQLLQAAAQLILQKASSSGMYLWVFEQNTKAKAFYEYIGGKNYETIQEDSFDGSIAQVCRYVWNDVSVLC